MKPSNTRHCLEVPCGSAQWKTYPRVPVRRLSFSLKAVSRGADRKHRVNQGACRKLDRSRCAWVRGDSASLARARSWQRAWRTARQLLALGWAGEADDAGGLDGGNGRMSGGSAALGDRTQLASGRGQPEGGVGEPSAQRAVAESSSSMACDALQMPSHEPTANPPRGAAPTEPLSHQAGHAWPVPAFSASTLSSRFRSPQPHSSIPWGWRRPRPKQGEMDGSRPAARRLRISARCLARRPPCALHPLL
ncbi:hypothetical protein BKA63DRAFT_488516 [Paraphoma chrysanthemicola]|nr:hypothetical protein BKA63DRAFT_488516 [Paraphoma chrysanthemicola]